MFRHIVVPLDGSMHAEQALPIAARLARAMGASLTLLRAVPLAQDLVWQSMGPMPDIASALEEEEKRASTYLEHVATFDLLKDIPVTTVVTEGTAAGRILAEEQDRDADLIVMCSHGETGMKRWMLGSVSLNVVRHTTVPVLLLRPTGEGTLTTARELPAQVRLLVPFDGSLMSEAALEPALVLTQALSAPQAGWLHLMGVVSLQTTKFMTAETQQAAVDAAKDYLVSVEERLRKQTAGTPLTVTSSVVIHSDVAEALVEAAEVGSNLEPREGAQGCDMIAMSTHGRSGLAHWVMGSVTERVLDATRLPLLIVRPATPAATRDESESMREEPHLSSWPGLL